MTFGTLVGLFSRRADIARRIAHAEKRFTGLTFDMTFKADSLSAEKWDEDVRITKVMQDCIGHRLERLRLSFFGPREPCTTENWWIVAWLRASWRGSNIGVPIERHYHRLVKIELMLYLVENHCKFDPPFWFEIAKWQLRDYQHDAKKVLEEFDKDLASRKKVNPVDVAHRAGLATAVQNALAEPEPLASEVDWTDVFTIYHLSFDPAFMDAIHSDRTPEKNREDLLKIIDDTLLLEPHFPPECYYLLLDYQ